MSATDRLNQIESQMDRTSYHPSKDTIAPLVAALRAVLEEIEKRKVTTGGRLTLADVLPKTIEEALS